jgi:hypothetical protein
MVDLRSVARQAASAAGIDPERFVRQIEAESGFDPHAFNAGSGATGIAQIVPRFHPEVDPTDPEASLRYAARWLRKQLDALNGSYPRALASYNWGPGNVSGYTKADGTVVPPWDGTRAELPEETQRYLDKILGPGWEGSSPNGNGEPMVFNADLATELQKLQWTCSIRSTTWCLKSIGIAITAEELHDLMVPGLANEDLGLLNASGAGIVQLISDRWNLDAHNQAPVSFDEVAARAGRQPVAIGGRNWGGPGLGHWSAVRGLDGAGNIRLANPAGTGPKFGQQTLSPDQFAAMGPFSAVWIDLEGAVVDPTPLPNPFRVSGTEGHDLRVRQEPSTEAAVAGSVPEGDRGPCQRAIGWTARSMPGGWSAMALAQRAGRRRTSSPPRMTSSW